jgi:hypothetical protein
MRQIILKGRYLFIVVLIMLNILLLFFTLHSNNINKAQNDIIARFNILMEQNKSQEYEYLNKLKKSYSNYIQLDNNLLVENVLTKKTVLLKSIAQDVPIIYYFSGLSCNQCINSDISLLKESELENLIFIGDNINNNECRAICKKHNIDENRVFMVDSIGLYNTSPYENYLFLLQKDLWVTNFYSN